MIKYYKSKQYKKLLKIKKRLDKRALRHPKTNPQMLDRVNWDRINSILHKRYGH